MCRIFAKRYARCYTNINMTRSKRKLKSIYGDEPFQFDKALKVWKMLPDMILFLIFMCYIGLSIMFFTTYSYYTVQHTSMQPLLNNYSSQELLQGVSDGVYVNTRVRPTVGDVIVVNSHIETVADTVVKRLIAVGGDKITIREVLLADGVSKRYEVLRIPKGNTTPYILVENNYVREENLTVGMKKVFENFQAYLEIDEDKEVIGGTTYLVLENDEIFYMGDNRGSSRDCSEYGPVKAQYVVGRVDIIVAKQENMFYHIMQYLLGFKAV